MQQDGIDGSSHTHTHIMADLPQTLTITDVGSFLKTKHDLFFFFPSIKTHFSLDSHDLKRTLLDKKCCHFQ